MYEGKPLKAGAEASLQTVTWADLSARLAAARDLRKALAQGEDGEGSFDAASARWIAHHSGESGGGKPDVNPDDLGNGKAADGMAVGQQAQPMPGDRGSE